MNNLKQDLIAGFVLTLIAFLFCAFILPIGIDKELARLEKINKINLEQRI